jgi:hypothetical protein
MIQQRNPRRWLAVSCVGLASLAFASAASANESASDRHPPGLLSPASKPAGVPSNYVLTHNGFFHPSCVVTVRSDESVGSDLVIRGMDGAEHARFEPCAYPSYSVSGAPPMGKAPHAPSVEHAPATYDGYIVYYTYEGSLPAGTSLSTQWTVPLAPIDTADQDIAFFNDIVTSAGGGNILQPVLDYNGEDANHWAIESENCCISGNDVQSTIVPVNAGDVILGTVTGTGCDSTGVCQAWTITTTDMTTGKSTTNNTTAPMGVPNGVSPGSLETYGVTACDMFPASGQVTFVDNAVTSGDGGTEKLKYDLLTLQGVAAEVPRDCGYGGSTSGNSYTLIFGTTLANDGGAGLDAGGAIDASHDSGAGVDAGAMDASINGSDGGSRDASEDSSGDDSSGGDGDAVASNDASSPDGAVDASVDSSGDAPTQSSDAATDSTMAMEAAAAGIDSGSSYEAGNAGASDGGGSATELTSGGPSGCGCALVGTNDDFGVGSLGSSLCLLIALGARQRRRGNGDRET